MPNGGVIYWECRCICGTERAVTATSLHNGRSRGCGCTQGAKVAALHTKHGASYSREYKVWTAMKQRCQNPRSQQWDRYGGRGITVDPRWETFEGFIADMGLRPTDRHSLERRDNNAGYSPENCYWATDIQQSRNTARNKYLTHDGITLTISAWAERTGIHNATLKARLYAGWSVDRALTTPAGRYVRTRKH